MYSGGINAEHMSKTIFSAVKEYRWVLQYVFEYRLNIGKTKIVWGKAHFLELDLGYKILFSIIQTSSPTPRPNVK